MALRLDPHDRPGAALKLELAGEAPTPAPAAPPSAFVEALFDQYAADLRRSRWSRSWATACPNCSLDAIRAARRAALCACARSRLRHRPDGRAPARRCASFLEGSTFRPACSPRRATRASTTGLTRPTSDSRSGVRPSADLVIAADVLIYLGALERDLRNGGAACLRRAVSSPSRSRRMTGPEDFVLRPRGAMRIRATTWPVCWREHGLRTLSSSRAGDHPAWTAASPIEGFVVIARHDLLALPRTASATQAALALHLSRADLARRSPALSSGR